MEVATLGGGCFWCLEAVFQELQGVVGVRSGYSGGHETNPSYRQVCAGETGHAEVVQVEFDPDVLAFEELLEVFFGIHDPTTLNRQGADVGTQYRSVIFHHSDEQRNKAKAFVTELDEEGPWSDPIVTEITPFEAFYPAEEYHENYFRRNPEQAYCRAVIDPKVAKFRKRFADKLRGAGTAS